uniref:Uncharacterized protein n=1 Tax=Rhizophora mucronata TaxID=61149 RepID=A0A2P2LXK7_RHIMU
MSFIKQAIFTKLSCYTTTELELQSSKNQVNIVENHYFKP